MTVEFNGINAGDITLVDLLKSWEIPKSKAIPEEKANELFVQLANAGRMLPYVSSLEVGRVGKKERQKFENQVIVTTQGQSVLTDQLRKQFERFAPQAGLPGGTSYLSQYKRFLDRRGIGAAGETLEEVQDSARKSLKTIGSAVYFPVGITKKGKVVVRKNYYLGKEIEDEFQNSSAWELISPESRMVRTNMSAVNVGLSVGSEAVLAEKKAGVRGSMTLADPGTLHLDAQGRIGEGFERGRLGMNKAVHMLYELMEIAPHDWYRVFTEGLTAENRDHVINPSLLTAQQIANGGQLLIVEEADGWVGKLESRRALHNLPTNIKSQLVMMGDVGHRVVFQAEVPSDEPFHGYIAKIDPKRNPYGVNIPPEQTLRALVASVGGFTGMPDELLELFEKARIGGGDDGITRVPQEREATQLAAVLTAAVIRILAEGGLLNQYAVVDVDQAVDALWSEKYHLRIDEERRQRALNYRMFQVESLVRQA